jgi:hypothetical protein
MQHAGGVRTVRACKRTLLSIKGAVIQMKKKKDPNIAFVNFETVCAIARDLPGAEESTSYGTPAFKVKGKLFARFHQDGESLVVSVDFDEREEMMNADPEKFYITEHYRNYPWILVRLSKVRPEELRDLLLGSWRRAAPKQMVMSLKRNWEP